MLDQVLTAKLLGRKMLQFLANVHESLDKFQLRLKSGSLLAEDGKLKPWFQAQDNLDVEIRIGFGFVHLLHIWGKINRRFSCNE